MSLSLKRASHSSFWDITLKLFSFAIIATLVVLTFIFSNIWIKILLAIVLAAYFIPLILRRIFFYFTNEGYKANATFWELFIAFIFFPSHYFIALIIPFSLLVFFHVSAETVKIIFFLVIFLTPLFYFIYLFYLSLKDKKLSFFQFLKQHFSGKLKETKAAIYEKNNESIEDFYKRFDDIHLRIAKIRSQDEEI
ncbi:MAG: hypothetical protein ACTSYD_07100 [Candidatus Heimdallarchaeaceae archaeon]